MKLKGSNHPSYTEKSTFACKCYWLYQHKSFYQKEIINLDKRLLNSLFYRYIRLCHFFTQQSSGLSFIQSKTSVPTMTRRVKSDQSLSPHLEPHLLPLSPSSLQSQRPRFDSWTNQAFSCPWAYALGAWNALVPDTSMDGSFSSFRSLLKCQLIK